MKELHGTARPLGRLLNRGRRWFSAGGRLVVLDDVFPHVLSAFRIAEYNAYLRQFPTAHVLSTGKSFRAFRDNRSFREVVAEYESLYPEFAGRVSKFDPRGKLRGRLAYTTFLHNIHRFLPDLERSGLPFVFTLYPGFQLEDADTDARLRRVFSSPGFRQVIVTQPITREYLASRRFCAPEQIEMVYGGVVPADFLDRAARPRKRCGADKDTIDICFVAFKYVANDLFKGYDLFVEAAKALAQRHGNLRFHVVGNFGPDDWDARPLGDSIRFYGPRPTSFFPEFYSNMDIILSPNGLPTSLPGAFNGFPTGCCAEAGLSGVAVFCADPLHQNVGFTPGEDIVIISREVPEIVEVVSRYCRQYDELCRLAERGKEAFRRVFDLPVQMEPRLRVLSSFLNGAK